MRENRQRVEHEIAELRSAARARTASSGRRGDAISRTGAASLHWPLEQSAAREGARAGRERKAAGGGGSVSRQLATATTNCSVPGADRAGAASRTHQARACTRKCSTSWRSATSVCAKSSGACRRRMRPRLARLSEDITALERLVERSCAASSKHKRANCRSSSRRCASATAALEAATQQLTGLEARAAHAHAASGAHRARRRDWKTGSSSAGSPRAPRLWQGIASSRAGKMRSKLSCANG